MPLRQLGFIGLWAVLLSAPIVSGAGIAWALAVVQILTLGALLAWVFGMIRAGCLEWRRTAFDLPLGLLVILVVGQVVVGSRALSSWALDPSVPGGGIRLPDRVLALGTVSTPHTRVSLALLLTYAAVYVLTVNVVRDRRQLQSLVRLLLTFGGMLAFLGLLEYLVGERRLLGPRHAGGLSRLAGTFVNPDHFGAWLTMIICLGVGYLFTRRRVGKRHGPIGHILTSAAGREDIVRRYLPAIAIGLMLLALIFTLSRGALISLAAALVFMLVLLAGAGSIRWTLVLLGSLLTVVGGYASWIGLAPLLARFAESQDRWLLVVSSLPMLPTFPVFGVGLGAYKDIYFHYQPAALGAGRVYFAYAHNDLLQLVLELGVIGGVLFVFAVWWVARDLIFAHLLGRGACPVGGGDRDLARRYDPSSVGIAIGALGAVVGLLTHSLFDFSARIPANGILGATCLAIATDALHTRFSRTAQWLAATRTWSLGDAPWLRWIVGAGALVTAIAVLPFVVRPALVRTQLEPQANRVPPERVATALRLDPAHPEALALRGAHRADMGRRLWATGLDSSGRAVPAHQRREEVQHLLHAAVGDFRTAILQVPTDPFFHEQLGLTYGTLATVDTVGEDRYVARALAHLERAIALAPQNALLHRSLAAYALTRPTRLLPIAIRAGRGATTTDPELLPDIVNRFSGLALTDAQWLALAPDSWIDRLHLGSLLEGRARFREAAVAYRDAIGRAPADDVVGLWLLARLLVKTGEGRAAVLEADKALRRDPDDPELQLVRGQALASISDPAALDALRLAADQADLLARQPVRDTPPFKLGPDRATARPQRTVSELRRLRRLVYERVGQRVEAVRYHVALGRYLVDRRLWAQAGAEWDQVLSATPRNAEAHFFRGQVWEALGARDRAIEELWQAVALDPRATFRLPLARLLWDSEQYYHAMNEWRAVLEREPDRVEARLGLAHAHLKEGDRIAAFRQFKHILQTAPDHLVARRELGKLTGAIR